MALHVQLPLRGLLIVWSLMLLPGCLLAQNDAPVGCRLDICLILDESGSVGAYNFDRIRTFVMDFLEYMTVSPQDTRVGLVAFSTGVTATWSLNKYTSRVPLQDAIRSLPYSGGETHLDKAILAVRSECFNTSGDRPDAPNLAILLTDGEPKYADGISDSVALQRATMEAEQARSEGIEFLAIGIGDIIFEYLYNIANGEDSVFEVKFSQLTSIVKKIAMTSCQSAKYCPTNQKQPEGFYPRQTSCPYLHSPTVEEKLYVEFRCSVNYSSETLLRGAKFYVQWVFDGELDPDIPEFKITPPETSVGLHERYLAKHLNQWLSCRARGQYPESASGPFLASRSYPVSILVSKEYINVYESDDKPQSVSIFSTLPPGCQDSGRQCSLDFNVVTSGHIAVYQETDHTSGASQCSFTLLNTEWNAEDSLTYNASRPLYIAPKGDPFFGKSRTTNLTITFRPRGKKHHNGIFYDTIWNNYILKEIKVVVHDSSFGVCNSTRYSRIRTFDKRRVLMNQRGVFVMINSSSNSHLEVQVKYKAGLGGQGQLSVPCGVAVREGSYVYALDACFKESYMFSGPLVIHQPQKPDPNVGVFQKNQSISEWEIRTLDGSTTRVVQKGTILEVYLKVSGKHKKKGSGLCGDFNGMANDDFRTKSGTVTKDISHFIESWRVQQKDSLFNGLSYVTADPKISLCDCQQGVIKEHNITECGLKALQDNSVSLGAKLNKVRALKPILLTQHGRFRRSPLVIERSDDINDVYFPEYVDETPGELTSLPDWATLSVTEEQAQRRCREHVTNLPLYAVCNNSDTVAETIDNCVESIQLSGELSSASDIDAQFEISCTDVILSGANITDRNNIMADTDLVTTLTRFSDRACPSQCAAHGHCVAGECRCEEDYFGPDCSATDDTIPSIRRYLTPDVCDLQERECRSVFIQANSLVLSNRLTCRSVITASDGTPQTFEYRAALSTSYNLRCPLPELDEPWYSYEISISNNGVHFSGVKETNRWVADTKCIECDRECVQKEKTCLISKRCYLPGESSPSDSCLVCDPDRNHTAWTNTTDQQSPYGAVLRIRGAKLEKVSQFIPNITRLAVSSMTDFCESSLGTCCSGFGMSLGDDSERGSLRFKDADVHAVCNYPIRDDEDRVRLMLVVQATPLQLAACRERTTEPHDLTVYGDRTLLVQALTRILADLQTLLAADVEVEVEVSSPTTRPPPPHRRRNTIIGSVIAAVVISAVVIGVVVWCCKCRTEALV